MKESVDKEKKKVERKKTGYLGRETRRRRGSVTLANFGGAQNFAIDSAADAARKSRRSNSPLVSAQLVPIFVYCTLKTYNGQKKV